MKVICVDTPAESYTTKGIKTTMPPIYVGNEYTVVDVINWSFNGKDWVVYELLEVPASPMHFYYASDLFTELSDIDETELVNIKEEVYA